jgi:hypothetical protein
MPDIYHLIGDLATMRIPHILDLDDHAENFKTLGRPLPLQVPRRALGLATVLQHRPAALRNTCNAAQHISMQMPAWN